MNGCVFRVGAVDWRIFTLYGANGGQFVYFLSLLSKLRRECRHFGAKLGCTEHSNYCSTQQHFLILIDHNKLITSII